ncbi:snRNA-activating protein complex, subunit 3 [Artemisia annua]|uniref:snRNA-activating protein complex, subunit 3 n=1 Tax=Artemisia annua TaxID=35608 RepID=A0A2U1MLZ2_ARTAN|nr:snRNA-activating protein complex, subunit 3 [Artemisia annua]
MEQEDSCAFEDVFVSIPRGGPLYVSDLVGPLTTVSQFRSSVEHQLKDLRHELCVDLTQEHLDEIFFDILLLEFRRNPLISKKEMEQEDSCAFEDVFVSIPRGGPLYVSDLVGPLTTVSQFRSSVEHQLKDLRHELCVDLTQEHLDEISTTNDERVQDADLACSVKSGIDEDYVPTNDLPRRSTRIRENRKMQNQVPKQHKRATRKDTAHEKDYMVEVEKLAKIKQKQEEDKSSARLHSFSGTSGPVSCVTLSEKKERMSSFNYTSRSTQVKSSNTREHIPLHDSEILLCVEVYYSNRVKTWVKNQEILVLGQQFLTELRDKIYCLSDKIMESAKKHDPSGYFLIEDIFYNDLREAGAIDYSKPILDWLRESKKTAHEKWECITSGALLPKEKEYLGSGSGPKMPQFTARSMQKTRFCDISFRLGAGYLYCHQGECKHLIVIRDMRLIHPEDVQNRAAYPLILFQSKLRFQKCSCCKIFKAVKVTTDDKWAPENPCYFCDVCYYMLHYKDDQLLYEEFDVFDYIHD